MEMRKVWTKPLAEAERFVANEYVAACGDSGVTYLFECNAGGGTEGNVYVENGKKAGLQTHGWAKDIALMPKYDGEDHYYHACGKTHEADSEDDFLNGYYLPHGKVKKAQNVIIWRGEDGDNIHCTTKLNKDAWETAKS